MNNELVSIIVPIYNGERYLNRCVDSICNQTYKNLEILLVNDGSKDNSLKICKEYETKDSRIVVINKENSGVSDSRNMGIDNSNGHYIMFVDCDDYMEPNMVEEMLYSLVENKVDVVRCKAIIQNKDDFVQNEELHGLENNIIKKEHFDSIVQEFFNIRGGLGCYIWALIIKKEHVLKFKTELFFREDTDYYIRLLNEIDSIYFLDKTLYNYVYNTSSVTKAPSNFDKLVFGIVSSSNEIKKELKMLECNYDSIVKNFDNQNIILTLNKLKLFSNDKISNIYKIVKRVFKNENILKMISLLSINNVPLNQKMKLFLVKHRMLFLISLYIKFK